MGRLGGSDENKRAPDGTADSTQPSALAKPHDAAVSGRPRLRQGMYTHGHDPSVLRVHRWRTAANSAAYLLAKLQPGDSILDVGCGPGTITVDLARMVVPGRVVGVDAEPEVLEGGRALADEVGLINANSTRLGPNRSPTTTAPSMSSMRTNFSST